MNQPYRDDAVKMANKGKSASSNRQLVEKAVTILRLLGKEPARPDEARKLLKLEG